MGKRIDPRKKRQALTILANGGTQRQAEKATGINHTTLSEELSPQVERLKKDIAEDFHADTAGRIVTLSKRLLEIVESGGEVLTKDVIKNQSGAAIATTMGILIDKMQLLTGGVTENVQISAGPKSDDFLKKLQEKSRRIESAKIIEAETITDNIITDISKNSLNNE